MQIARGLLIAPISILQKAGGTSSVIIERMKSSPEARKHGQQAPQKRLKKVLVSLRISAEALAIYKRGGKGYQTRMAEILAAGAPALVPQPPHPKKGRFDGLLRLAGTWDNKLSAEEFIRKMRKRA